MSGVYSPGGRRSIALVVSVNVNGTRAGRGLLLIVLPGPGVCTGRTGISRAGSLGRRWPDRHLLYQSRVRRRTADPMTAHLAVDGVAGAVLLVSRWVFGFADPSRPPRDHGGDGACRRLRDRDVAGGSAPSDSRSRVVRGRGALETVRPMPIRLRPRHRVCSR